ncbi:MAG: DUF481 domain-containing protein [Verrucomicrobia bacterium]|nr:DUF481 domain-containing protein [Verrucomicrobiota bacterium]
MYKRMQVVLASAMMMALVAGSAVAEEADGWATTVSLGATKTSGNSDTLLATLGVAAENGSEVNPARFGVEGTYGESETEDDSGRKQTDTTAENAKAYANYKRVLESGAYGYLDGNVVHDDLADIDYRATAGPGVGFFVYKSDEASCGLEVGAAYIREKVAGVEDDYAAVRAAERYERQLSETAKLWQSIEYLPRADDFEDYLINGEIGIDAAVKENVSLRLVVQDKYDNTPAVGNDQNDLTIISAVNVRL